MDMSVVMVFSSFRVRSLLQLNSEQQILLRVVSTNAAIAGNRNGLHARVFSFYKKVFYDIFRIRL